MQNLYIICTSMGYTRNTSQSCVLRSYVFSLLSCMCLICPVLINNGYLTAPAFKGNCALMATEYSVQMQWLSQEQVQSIKCRKERLAHHGGRVFCARAKSGACVQPILAMRRIVQARPRGDRNTANRNVVVTATALSILRFS